MSDTVAAPTPTEAPAPTAEASVATETTTETTEAPQGTPQTFKIKIDGQEREFTQDQILQFAQKAVGSEKRFEEAAEKEKRLATLIERYQQNPEELMAAAGIDRDQLADRILHERLRKANMTPEQMELEKYRGEAETYKEQATRLKAEAEHAKNQIEQQRSEKEWLTKINGELAKHDDIPKTEKTIGLFASYVMQGREQGLELSMDQVAALVREDYRSQAAELIRMTPPDKLAEVLGEDVLKAIRKADLDRVRGGERPIKGAPTQAPSAKKARMTTTEYFNMIQDRLNS